MQYQSGFGDATAQFNVYIANVPPMAEYADMQALQPLQRGEIELINRACGNGWRKLFNVYAKLLFALPASPFGYTAQAQSWQQFRDQHLLQASSNTALLFSAPQLNSVDKSIHIIAGRTWAKELVNQGLPLQLQWLNAEFAIDKNQRVLVCPYFDYRQLNNEKISYLVQLIMQLIPTKS